MPGGGIAVDAERWVSARDDFFLPVKVLGRLFRGAFLGELRKLLEHQELDLSEDLRDAKAWHEWLDRLYATEWNVYCKPPFGGSSQALGYLARYTHCVAIANHRFLRIDGDEVVFRFKDLADEGRSKTTRLEGTEFIRRFLMHVLPNGFHRIRYYGLLANRHRAENLERCKGLLGVEMAEGVGHADEEKDRPVAESWQELLERRTGIDSTVYPVCGVGRLVHFDGIPAPKETSPSRGPPP